MGQNRVTSFMDGPLYKVFGEIKANVLLCVENERNISLCIYQQTTLNLLKL